MSAFDSLESISHQASLWLDQHAPLMLALERGEAVTEHGALLSNLDPLENTPMFPILPSKSMWQLPMLWAQKNQSFLSKHGILKLLWKASPRKSHSNDVSKMIRHLMNEGDKTANIVLSIYRCSILGNYRHSTSRPPLPLRFRAYRMNQREESKHAVSKHPFMLYALKECLVSCVRNDFGLNAVLSETPEWVLFQERVLYCADRVLRPYAAVSESISARLLLTHGKKAPLSQSAISSVPRRAAQFIKESGWTPVSGSGSGACSSVPFTGITESEWSENLGKRDRAKLVYEKIIAPEPSISIVPLPKQITKKQARYALPGSNEIYTCSLCKSGFFVGHNIGGKKKEALGDALTGKWYCPSCSSKTPNCPLVKTSTVGRIVFCSNGTHSCCIHCGKPTFFLSESVECEVCRRFNSEETIKARNIEMSSCWYVGCKRVCREAFDVVPEEGVEDGGSWKKCFACSVHSLPKHVTELPIPSEAVRKLWFSWKTSTNY